MSKVKCPTCGWHTNQLLEYPSELPTFSFPDRYDAKCKFQCLQVNCLSVFEYTLEMSVPNSDPSAIVVENKIDRQTLEDIFVTALEGGSNYWYVLSDEAVRLIRDAVPKKIEPALSVALFNAVFDHGVEVPVHDAENPLDDELGVLSRSTFKERLQKLVDSPEAWALRDEFDGKGDAGTSDIIFQFLVMGEVVYG